jgi:hypothetical protein
LPEKHCRAHHGEGCQDDLSAAEAKELGAHAPEVFRLQLQPDKEQHHDNAELGEVLDRDDIDA